MGRAIVATAATPAGSATRGVPDGDAPPINAPADPYGDRLLKLIPGEVISLYISMVAILSSTDDKTGPYAPWVILALGAGATFLYLRVTLKVSDVRQLGVSVGAFCVWAFAIGGPFKDLSWYSGAYAGMALAAFTFVAPMIPMGKADQAS